MKELSVSTVALVVGVFLGGVHLLWSLAILFGFAQPLMDFIFWAHMLDNPWHVTGFTLTQAAVLVVVTFVIGYVSGWVFGWLWNKMHK